MVTAVVIPVYVLIICTITEINRSDLVFGELVLNRGELTSQFKSGNYDLAIEFANACLRQKPKDYEVLMIRANAQCQMGRYDADRNDG